MLLNFNSSSASHYTLYCSNEEAEQPLSGQGVSSASNFRVNLVPSLDLNQLSHFQSTEVEARISNLQIDSLPLTFSGDETIDTFITIDPKITKDNLLYNKWIANEDNNKPLSIGVGDYHATTNTSALIYLNQLLINSANLFVLKRYLELVTDSDNLFLDTAFKNLDVDSPAEISPEDCELLRKYLDIAVYTRLKIFELLKEHIKSKITVNANFLYKNGVFVKTEEESIVQRSKLLGPIVGRVPVIPGIGTPELLIDFSLFHDTSFNNLSSKANVARLEAAKETIRV